MIDTDGNVVMIQLLPAPFVPVSESCPGCASVERLSDTEHQSASAQRQKLYGRRYGLSRPESIAGPAVDDEWQLSVEELEAQALAEVADA